MGHDSLCKDWYEEPEGKEVHDSHSEDYADTFDWRRALEGPYQERNIDKMKTITLPDVQHRMMELAFSKSDSVSYNACAFLLGQSGHGVVSKIEHTMEYQKLPENQLVAILLSKIRSLKHLNPNFDVQKLLSAMKEDQSGEVLEGEFEEDLQSQTSTESPQAIPMSTTEEESND